MEMEVIMPSPPTDSNYGTASTSPYLSASSSPQRFNSLFFSAPGSPTHFSSSEIPFNWEQKPGIPKSEVSTTTSSNYGDVDENLEEIDFAFDFSSQLDKGSLSAADELFDRGKIKPLKPPPRFQHDRNKSAVDSPKSPRSPKKLIKEAFSPRQKKESDPFAEAAAAEQTSKDIIQETIPSPRTNGTRSLSSFRVSDLLFDPEFNQEEEPAKSSNSTWYKKWRIKDLLLFRSASENRTTEQNQAQKYALFKKTQQDDMKNLSFRSIDTVRSASARRKTGPPVSPHELHYTANRAASEEMKKKTFLPYKQGVLGCLKFRSDAHEMSKGIGSISRG